MTRRECLDKAAECVLQDRASQYGGPEDNFGRIAKLWSTYTGTVLDGIDVAMMMALLKVARIRNNKGYEDGYIDLAGYAACGAELAGRAEAYKQSIEAAGEEYKKLRAEAEAQPEFNRGDKVEVQMAPDSSTWASATIMAVYRDKDTCEWRYCVDFEDGWAHVTVPSARVRHVSGIKAEGCDELVQKDAPQTREELMQRIVDCNPSVYPRTPTGEELAEMAEEVTHE